MPPRDLDFRARKKKYASLHVHTGTDYADNTAVRLGYKAFDYLGIRSIREPRIFLQPDNIQEQTLGTFSQ